MQTREQILGVVESLGYRVTAGDVSAQSGLELALAQQGLNSLAQDADGHLQVSSTGEIVYAFERNARDRLAARERNAQLKAWLKRAGQVLFYLVRISFGLLLIASLVLIAVAIYVLLNASRGDNDNDNRDRGGPMFIPGFYWYDVWFFFSPPGAGNPRRRDPNRMGFLESVFSFLFGDGDPNTDIEERRWQIVAGTIRSNSGVVVAEQLAPYLEDASTENEDFVLPALVKFDGQPEVSEQGEIVYRFPALQLQAAERRTPERLPDSLSERLWQFSRASGGQIALAVGLGVLNFVGAWFVFFALQEVVLPPDFEFLVAVAPVLVVYGTFFLGIPAVRYAILQWLNNGIKARNERRSVFSRQLRELNAQLRQKLEFARRYGERKVIGADDIIYTTEKSTFEQRDADLDAKRFRDLEES